MIAWGDSNGTTLTDSFLANVTNSTGPPSRGVQVPNYLDSLIRASMRTGKGLNIAISDVLPMVHPNDLVLGGWNISAPLDMKRDTQVLDYDAQRQVRPYSSSRIHCPEFIAANQDERADSLISGEVQKQAHFEHSRNSAKRGLDRVVAFWTALLKTPSCLGASSPASNTYFIFGNDLKTSQAKSGRSSPSSRPTPVSGRSPSHLPTIRPTTTERT
ncbi:hypothetical protein M407DRAFT_235266 [Tulasnella calospora MUT 4182]|uniref:Uncharacterized protein n=1 Tax=Tulasnella calospora MUT 4182 TaxID=1051891 RepID=A0A0C3L2D3_9AGAM|nr:hypothetical protein M407DRAFT_235266 [Tulasnella calospora MUT 4182]